MFGRFDLDSRELKFPFCFSCKSCFVKIIFKASILESIIDVMSESCVVFIPKLGTLTEALF